LAVYLPAMTDTALMEPSASGFHMYMYDRYYEQRKQRQQQRPEPIPAGERSPHAPSSRPLLTPTPHAPSSRPLLTPPPHALSSRPLLTPPPQAGCVNSTSMASMGAIVTSTSALTTCG
jgi:hypothetical protein